MSSCSKSVKTAINGAKTVSWLLEVFAYAFLGSIMTANGDLKPERKGAGGLKSGVAKQLSRSLHPALWFRDMAFKKERIDAFDSRALRTNDNIKCL